MMSAEFTNIIYDVNKTLKHCFRQQAARCHEYVIFMNRMRFKYPDFNFAVGNPQLHAHVPYLTFITTNYSNWKSVDNQLKTVDGFNQDDRSIFAVKYARMLEAKKLFERLEGDYEKFR